MCVDERGLRYVFRDCASAIRQILTGKMQICGGVLILSLTFV